MENDMVSLGLYFEVMDSEIYGGKGTIGYASIIVDLTLGSLDKSDVYKFAEEQRKNFAKLCSVEDDKVKIISRPSYEENVVE